MSAAPASRASRGLAFASDLLGALAILVGAAAWFHPNVDGSDLWWHLASGRYIWEHGAIPLTDPFSHTASGQPWTNHSWLWGWLFWAAYAQDVDAVAWLNLGLLVAVFGLVAWNAARASRSWWAAGAATWLAAAACHWYLDVRPHIVTLLFTALLLASLSWRRAPWLWPPLLALWVNLHAGFFFGLGLVGLHALSQSAAALRQHRRLPRAPWLGLACAALAVGLNPWGFAIYGVPFEPLDRETPFRALVEWRALVPTLDPTTYAGRFGWLALLAAVGSVRARRTPFSIAIAAVTAAMALAARRFVPLFAISAAPLAALGLMALFDRARRRLPSALGPRLPLRLAASGAALLVAALLWRGVDFLPRPLQRWTAGEAYPSGAAAYLAALPDPPRHLFNYYDWGGYLMLQAPGVPVFIDGRAGTVYDDALAEDYFRVIDAAADWREKLAARRVDAVLVPTGLRLSALLRRQRPAWRVAYIDPRSVLLFPPEERTGDALPVASQLLPDGADLQLSRGFRLRRRGELAEAAAALATAQRMDPMQVFVYGELLRVAALQQDALSLRRWIEEGLRVYPRRRDQIWAFAENAWGRMGMCEARLDALHRLRGGSPFAPGGLEEEVRARIRALEAGPDAAPDLDCRDRGSTPHE